MGNDCWIKNPQTFYTKRAYQTWKTGGVEMLTNPQHMVALIDGIQVNILEKSHVQDKELAQNIARTWVRKAVRRP